MQVVVKTFDAENLSQRALRRDHAAQQPTSIDVTAAVITKIQHQFVDMLSFEIGEYRFELFVVPPVRRPGRLRQEFVVYEITDPPGTAYDQRIGQYRRDVQRFGGVHRNGFLVNGLINFEPALHRFFHSLHPQRHRSAPPQYRRVVRPDRFSVDQTDPVPAPYSGSIGGRSLHHELHPGRHIRSGIVGIIALVFDPVSGDLARNGRFRRSATFHRRVKIVIRPGMFPVVVGRTRGQQSGEKVFARLVVIGSYRLRIIVIEVLPDHLRIDPAVGGGIRSRIGRSPFRRAFGTGYQHQTRQHGKPPFQSVHNSGFNPTIPSPDADRPKAA